MLRLPAIHSQVTVCLASIASPPPCSRHPWLAHLRARAGRARRVPAACGRVP